MDKRRLDELLAHLETHLECWRQFNGFVMKGKDGDFDATDEAEFLEIKSSLVQQLEVIRNYIEEGGPNREAIHLLIGSAPSIAAVGQMGDTGQRSLESNWHQIFVAWQTVLGQIKAQGLNLGLPELLAQLENHVEYWKQFRSFIVLAQNKSFTAEDEQQFLEVKSGMVQELEIILGSIERGAPDRAEIHELITNAASVRYLSELGVNSLRTLESNWHQIYLSWQGVIGLLKLARKELGLKELIVQLENHIDGLKQFSQFVTSARDGEPGEDDEEQFLELKSSLMQELEIIMGSIDDGAPDREEMHEVIAGAPSLKYITGLNENSRRSLENNWHKVYLQWQAVLGKLKVLAQREGTKKKGFFSRIFGG